LADLAAFAGTIAASQEAAPALGAISYSKKSLQPKIIAGEDEENKKR
jgi:hypothetical protein